MEQPAANRPKAPVHERPWATGNPAPALKLPLLGMFAPAVPRERRSNP
jgi:hypothetical protein